MSMEKYGQIHIMFCAFWHTQAMQMEGNEGEGHAGRWEEDTETKETESKVP